MATYTKAAAATDAAVFSTTYKDRSRYAEFDIAGNLIKLETQDAEIIAYAESKGMVAKDA